MPSLAAAIIGSIIGWIIDAVVEPFMGIEGRLFGGLVLSTIIYVDARTGC